jgi:uncharacterized membrane protein (DUF485 family)
MSDNASATTNATAVGGTATALPGTYIQHGEHVDTIETVDRVFTEQRKLSFTYGAFFFAGTLAIPAMSVWLPGWYGTPIWGGFTWNYLIVSLIYFVFLWVMAWTYSKQADKLDEKLMQLADEAQAEMTGGGAS